MDGVGGREWGGVGSGRENWKEGLGKGKRVLLIIK